MVTIVTTPKSAGVNSRAKMTVLITWADERQPPKRTLSLRRRERRGAVIRGLPFQGGRRHWHQMGSFVVSSRSTTNTKTLLRFTLHSGRREGIWPRHFRLVSRAGYDGRVACR